MTKPKVTFQIPNSSKDSDENSLEIISIDYQVETLYHILLKTPSLINQKDKKQNTFLSYAIKRKNIEVSELILTSPILDYSFQDQQGNSYLHLSILNKLQNISRNIILKIPNKNLQNNDGNTALHFAYSTGDEEIISFLIKNGVDQNIKNKNGLLAKEIKKDTFEISDNKCFIIGCGEKIKNERKGFNKSIKMDWQNTKNSSQLKYSLISMDDSDEEEKGKQLPNKTEVIKHNFQKAFQFNANSYQQKINNNDNIINSQSEDIVNINTENKLQKQKTLPSNTKQNEKYPHNPKTTTKNINDNQNNDNNIINNNQINQIKDLDDNFSFSPFTSVIDLGESNNSVFSCKSNNSNDNISNINTCQGSYDQLTNYSIENKTLNDFLSEIDMEKYYITLNRNGFDDINVLIDNTKGSSIAITDKQLKEAGVNSPGDRAKIIIHLQEKAGNFLCEVPRNVYHVYDDMDNLHKDFCFYKLHDWFKNLGLENYVPNFIENGYNSLELLLAQMYSKNKLNDEILKDGLGIKNDKHRQKILNKLIEEKSKWHYKLRNSNFFKNGKTSNDFDCLIY